MITLIYYTLLYNIKNITNEIPDMPENSGSSII